ncbi:MAG TPA: antibiotic biosynthesis monooxygenase [Stellaceae bacterium]
MRGLLGVLAGGAMMLAGCLAPAAAQSTGSPEYAVTYFDIGSKDFDKAAQVLRPFAAETRKEDGNREFTLLDEVGRSGRFAIVEAWRDKATMDAHAAAMKTLAGKLQPYVEAPFSTRAYQPLSVAPPSAAEAQLGTAMYVLTHIDVFPAGKDDVAELIKGFVAASRKDKGEERCDALVWDGHLNHFQLIEAWTDHLAREAHAYDDHSRAFRAKLTPYEGAPYDERLYEVVR